MTTCATNGLSLIFPSLNLFLIGFLFFNSSEIFAEGTETTHITENYSSNYGKDTSHTDAVLEEEFEMECLWLACDQTIALATRQEIPASKAPGIVTVITAEEIKNLGYRTFVEILRTVPGFELLKAGGGVGTVFPAVRGLVGLEKVRLMLNGHFVNSPLDGDAFTYFDDFPVENIKRIEIVRGPGSAVYGENAFSAVINIITFDAKDINGVKVSGGYGSFDTEEGNIVFGKTCGKVDISGMVRYRHTDGFDGIIESDIVTRIDNALVPLGFPPASQAPGRVRNWRQEYDLNLKVAYKGFYIEGLYINKK
ncbi:MAG: hypothetical protein QG591_2582 [Planctomycetota bacterium]|nr:hypothetical protein [Planctomycetota bacterium]